MLDILIFEVKPGAQDILMSGRRDAYIWLEGLKHASQIYASLYSNLVYEIYSFRKGQDEYISFATFEMSISGSLSLKMSISCLKGLR